MRIFFQRGWSGPGPRCDSTKRKSGKAHRREKWQTKREYRAAKNLRFDQYDEESGVSREFYTAANSILQILSLLEKEGLIERSRETRSNGEDDSDGIDIWIFLPSGLVIPLQVLRKSANQNDKELIDKHLTKYPHVKFVIVIGTDDRIPISESHPEKAKRTKLLYERLRKLFFGNKVS